MRCFRAVCFLRAERPSPAMRALLAACALYGAGVMLAPRAALAQARVTERHHFDQPEGRLLAFYAAALAFSPTGVSAGERLAVGLEASYVPYLDASQRRPSIDKPEATNLAPAFARLRLGGRLGGGIDAEAAWIPPVRVFDVTANVLSLALSRTVATARGVRLTPRLWGTVGRVRGAITCSGETMLARGPDLAAYFATVCHGRESDDWFEPTMLGADLVASRAVGEAMVYAVAGLRRDHTTFDIGVRHADGRRDSDHPILELRTTRPQVALGATWRPRPRLGASAEAFYAPGSLLTARVAARWTVRP